MDVDQIVFQCSEETLSPDIIQCLAFSIHRDLYIGFFKQVDVVRISKMTTLVAIDDFWFCNA